MEFGSYMNLQGWHKIVLKISNTIILVATYVGNFLMM